MTQKVVRRVAENLTDSRITSGRALPPDRAFVGGYIGRVTPVPIPNTVVKPAKPMILLQRESRSLPAFLQRAPISKRDRGSFFARALVRGIRSQSGIQRRSYRRRR